jgi:UDP-N-acetyl-D-mannosaminuronic acid dehydrogenase
MEYSIKTVCVVGLGYIGLPTAATLAGRGVDVISVDINPDVVETVNAGQPYFSEPDLDMLLRAATTLRKLRATQRPEPADAFVIAVPTPSTRTAPPTSITFTRRRTRSRPRWLAATSSFSSRPPRSAPPNA